MLAPIPPRPHPGADTHAFWEGFLSPEDIAQINALPNWHLAKKGSVGGMNGQGQVLDMAARVSDVAWFDPDPSTEHIWQKITNTIADVNSQFFKFDLTGCYESAQLTLYLGSEEGRYNWHVDAGVSQSVTPVRKLSMSLLLNDPSEFEGGELQLKTTSDEIVTVQQAQGRAWFFPSYTLHRVSPVTKGVRRSLVLWVGGPPFR